MELIEATGALAALAQPSRLAVFRLLVSSGPPCAGDLAVELALPKPTLSFHLKELTRAGLIGAERDGRVIYYGVSAQGFRELMEFLTEDCCQGKPELCFPEGRRRAPARSIC